MHAGPRPLQRGRLHLAGQMGQARPPASPLQGLQPAATLLRGDAALPRAAGSRERAGLGE
eukprot:6094818-Pyramimonas_sp.AAC.1